MLERVEAVEDVDATVVVTQRAILDAELVERREADAPRRKRAVEERRLRIELDEPEALIRANEIEPADDRLRYVRSKSA